MFSAPYMIPFLERFRPIFDRYNLDLIVPEVTERLNEQQILNYAGSFDGTICGDDHYTARALNACSPRLKVISKWGTGIDSIDSKTAHALDIQVYRTLNAFTVPVADSVMGYILAFARRQPWMDRDVKAGRWEKLPGKSLSECTLGVIGVGNIGKSVLERAQAFEMKTLGNDIVEIDPEFVNRSGVEMISLTLRFKFEQLSLDRSGILIQNEIHRGADKHCSRSGSGRTGIDLRPTIRFHWGCCFGCFRSRTLSQR
jgi:D-3-phosphoglycerate dehydrogenase